MQNPPVSLSKKHRPPGIVILAILYFVVSLVMLCFVLPAISSLPAPALPEQAGRIANQEFLLWCEAITGFIASVGLWLLAEWARWLAIARAIAVLLVSLGMSGSEAVTGSTLLQVLVSVAIVVYLLQPGIRKTFAA